MTDFPFDIVGFDLDGTLVDTQRRPGRGGQPRAGRGRARRRCRSSRSRPMIGGGARQMLQQALAATGGCDERARRLLPVLLDYYEAQYRGDDRPFPGVIDGARCAGGARRRARRSSPTSASISPTCCSRELGLTDRFACVIGGDTIGPARPSPTPRRSYEMIRALRRRPRGVRRRFALRCRSGARPPACRSRSMAASPTRRRGVRRLSRSDRHAGAAGR